MYNSNMTNISYIPNLISILVPTRERPKNVIRLIESIFTQSLHKELVEIIFYVDFDDFSFPEYVLTQNVRLVRGPKIFDSLMHNVLYTHAKGEILMWAADDIQFESKYWDSNIRKEFEKVPDRILIVYPNDKGSYAGKIAIHGFIHRRWVEAVKYFAYPSRNSLMDLWHTENASKLDRLVFLPDLIISHLHYRQGLATADFDETYKKRYSESRSWAPKITYKKLARERRIDRIILSEIMDTKPKNEYKYFIGDFLAKNKNNYKIKQVDPRRLKSISNYLIILIILKNICIRLFRVATLRQRTSSK